MKETFITSNLYYFSSQFVILLISVVQGFVVPKLLDPADYGLYGMFGLVIAYSRTSHLGILSVYDREYPRMIATGKSLETDKFRDACFSLTTITSCLYAIGVLIYLIWNFLTINSLFVIACFFALSLIFDNINEFTVENYRSNRRFSLVSINRGIGKIGLATLIVLFTYHWGLKGTLSAMILYHVLINCYFVINDDRPSLMIDVKLFRYIIPQGFSLYRMLILATVFVTFDKLFVSKFFTVKDFGIYNFGFSIASMISVFGSSIGYVLYTYMLDDLGKGFDLKGLLPYFERTAFVVTWTLPIILSFSYIFCSFFIPVYFSHYQDVLYFLPFLFIVVFFFGFSQIPDNVIIATKSHNVVIRNQLIALVFGICAFTYIVLGEKKIDSVAFYTAVYTCMYSMLSLFYVGKVMYNRKRDFYKLLISCLLPGAVLFYATFLINRYGPNYLCLFTSSIFLQMAIQMIAVSFVSIPFLVYLNKRTMFVDIIVNVIRAKLGT